MIGGPAIKRLVGPRWTTWGRTVLSGLGRPRWGNLRRVTPFSSYFGFDRGTPLDRYYVDKVMRANAGLITGRVLEIQAPGHVHRYGHEVIEAHSLDINPAVAPTYLCDLAAADIVPSASYDCFLLPNTLPFLKDLEGALREARRIVRSGGAIIATVPCLVPLIPDGPEYWHPTAEGCRVLAARVWPDCRVEVTAYGNCLAAAATMYGLALEELTAAELEVTDPRFPVIVGIVCRVP
jgi:hypothetical protein